MEANNAKRSPYENRNALFRHTIAADELQAALPVVQALLDTLENDAVIKLQVDGRLVDVPAGLVEPLLNVVSLLTSRGSLSLLVLDESEFVSPTQAAELLGVSLTVVRGWLEAGDLPHRTVGRNKRISTIDLAHFAAEEARFR